MTSFVYQAIRKDGARVKGELMARNKSDAFQQLDKQKLQPVSLVPASEAAAAAGKSAAAAAAVPTGKQTLSRKQVVQFTEEMSDLLDAGLQLEPALQIMEGRQEASAIKTVCLILRQNVRQGQSFSNALRSVSDSFGDMYCNLASAGEISGALPKILRRQHAYLVMVEELRGRVVSALIYPAFLVLAGGALITLFMTKLVPQLKTLFSNAGSTMPLLTRMLIGFSEFLTSWWWLLLVLGVAFGMAFKAYTSQPAGRVWWDRVKLDLPLVGAVLSARFFTQFAQTLATLVTSGVPLLTGLRLMHKANTNTYVQDLLGRVVEMVSDGGALTRALRKVGFFPPMFIDIITVGEQTGDLGLALERAATRYDKELNVKIERLTAMIQPALIFVLAIVVGLVAYSIMSGIFQAVSGLRVQQ
jgi:type II secretory pathway component PulF